MKNNLSLIATAISITFLVACQKDFSIIDSPNPTTDTTTTSIVTAAKAAILNVTVNGTYKKDSVLGINNKLAVRIKVAAPGTYQIYSHTVKGFHFNTSVTYTDTGYKDLFVPGTGTPLTAGNATFVLRFDTSSYSFMVPVQDITSPGSGPVAGTLGYQQELYGVIGTLREVFTYDPGGLIKEIKSSHYPDRKIFYNSNRTISKIEYWYTNGNGVGTYRSQVRSFEYDTNGNVSRINDLDTVTNQPRYAHAEYVYNADNTLKSRKSFYQGRFETEYFYLYKDGNLTSLIDRGDTSVITYDNRTNNFKNIYPQFYFLDIQTVFEQTYRSEIFFFSKNYPTQIDFLPISVSTTSNGLKPFEIKFDVNTWYRYGYN